MSKRRKRATSTHSGKKVAFSGNSEDAVNSGLDDRDVGEVCHDQEQLELHQDAQKA